VKGRVKLGQPWNAGCVDCKARACQDRMMQLGIDLTDEHGMDHVENSCAV